MGDGNYIGYTGASSTVVSVVADIAESLDISGFTPSIAVSSIPALAVSSLVLDAPIAVSGTILDTIAANVLTTSSVAVASMPTTTVTGSVTAAVSFPASTGITGGGTESGAQRVTIANNSTGVLSVDDGGGTLTVDGTVTAGIQPSTSSYLSHVYIDLDATGDNPATNTEVIAAPGSGNKLVIYGVQGSIVGSAAAAAGNWYLSDGNTSAATTLWTGRAQGITNTQFELTFPYGVALTTNTALKVTSTEASNHIFINAVVYYRTEAV